ncbi:alpha/beta hydrolase [Mycobacterium hubeiense]|uniref:alpha/beta hydrolase n=1 Tax=Mycobacterium hubeiense TaxID=1867256 RepID=UPI000C7EAADA|nr:alpha/beta fold hydrolase [Mycobacterium sp. QGD 101]
MSNVKAPIVLIHALWLSPRSWSGWVERYQAAGHDVHVPDWPRGAEVGVGELVEHFDMFVRSLPDSPILMGHSFGGLLTQMLLDRGLGRAGVALTPAAPRGVLRAPLSVLRATWPVFRRPANRHRLVTLTPSEFHYAFANTVSREESDRWYAELAVPAPGRPVFQVAAANLTRKREAVTVVDFANSDRAPLLLIAGGRDHLVPESVVYENFNRYRKSTAPTDFKLFEDRPHLITVVDGWQDVADYALTWTAHHTR